MKSRVVLCCGAFLLGIGAHAPADSPGGALPKAYGTTFQQVHVGASAFREAVGDGHSFDYISTGYLINVDSDELLVAPLTLPPGAEIHALCLYAFDDNEFLDASVGLRSARLVPGGLEPGVAEVGPWATSSWDTGFGVICRDFAPPYTYTEAAEEDGVALAHFLVAFLHPGMAIGGVKVIWRQQVSPPPASASFGDVATSHQFFQFIEALAASGITAGCGGGNYCPAQALTRGEMAVFLAKALGLHWPY